MILRKESPQFPVLWGLLDWFSHVLMKKLQFHSCKKFSSSFIHRHEGYRRVWRIFKHKSASTGIRAFTHATLDINSTSTESSQIRKSFSVEGETIWEKQTNCCLPFIRSQLKKGSKKTLIEKFLKFQRVFKVCSTAQWDGVEKWFSHRFFVTLRSSKHLIGFCVLNAGLRLEFIIPLHFYFWNNVKRMMIMSKYWHEDYRLTSTFLYPLKASNFSSLYIERFSFSWEKSLTEGLFRDI